MKFRHQKSEEVSVNITALIDIVFLLLIFFMISTTFKKESYIELNLPKASAEEKLENSVKIEIVIDINGDYAINGMTLINSNLNALKRAIKKISVDNKTPLIISADAKSPHQAFVSAMDAAGQLGFSRISITTMKEQVVE